MIETTYKLDFDTYLMCKFRGDIETEPGSTCFAGTIVFATVKLLEDLALVGLADANTCIFYGEFYDSKFLLGTHCDRSLFGVFDRVGDKVL